MNRLKSLRIAAGMTQEQLALAANIKLSTLQKIERGFTDLEGIRLGNALKLAQALGITVEDLAKDADEE